METGRARGEVTDLALRDQLLFVGLQAGEERVSLIPNPDGPPFINGCRDINPFSDGVICHDSAMLFHPQALPQVGTNLTPSIQWPDDGRIFQHARDIGPPALNVLCGNKSGAVSIINPSPIGQLFMALKDFLNALR